MKTINCMEISNKYDTRTWQEGTENAIRRSRISRSKRKEVLKVKALGLLLLIGGLLVPSLDGDISVTIVASALGLGLMFL